MVRRIVDAAALPDLLGRETATAMLEAAAADSAVVFVRLPGGSDVRLVAAVGGDLDVGETMARSSVNGQSLRPRRRCSSSRWAATSKAHVSRWSPLPVRSATR